MIRQVVIHYTDKTMEQFDFWSPEDYGKYLTALEVKLNLIESIEHTIKSYLHSCLYYQNGKVIRFEEYDYALSIKHKTTYYYCDNQFHREDGPAIECEFDNQRAMWYLNGKRLYCIPCQVLFNYSKRLNLNLTLLLTDNNKLIRESAKAHYAELEKSLNEK